VNEWIHSAHSENNLPRYCCRNATHNDEYYNDTYKYVATPKDEMAAESEAAKKPEQPRVYPKSVPKKSTFALPEITGRRFRNAK
jgi:hypothetical protein